MATHEIVQKETARFAVVDAFDRPHTVFEITEYLVRVSVTRKYPPVVAAVNYMLKDKTKLRRPVDEYFDTLDGIRRFFVVEKSA